MKNQHSPLSPSCLIKTQTFKGVAVSLCVAPHAPKADASTLAEESIQVSQTQVSTSDLVFMSQWDRRSPLIQHNICLDGTNRMYCNLDPIFLAKTLWAFMALPTSIAFSSFSNDSWQVRKPQAVWSSPRKLGNRSTYRWTNQSFMQTCNHKYMFINELIHAFADSFFHSDLLTHSLMQSFISFFDSFVCFCFC